MITTEQLIELGMVATTHQSHKAEWARNNKESTGAIAPVTHSYWEAM